MKTIIVPTDFSPEASYSYPVAANIAKAHNAKVILFHVVPSTVEMIYSTAEVMPSSLEQSTEREIKESKENVDKLLSSDVFKGVEVETKIAAHTKGSETSEISKFIESKNVDLAVMGTKGADGITEVLVGSNAEIVVRHAKCPVITVSKETTFDVKKVVLATDFKNLNKKFIGRVNSLMNSFPDAELNVVFINTGSHFRESSYISEQFKVFQEKYDLKVDNFDIYNANIVEEGIANYAKTVEADLIVVPTHGRTGISHIINGSIAEDIVNHSEIPVYTYNIHMDRVAINKNYSQGSMGYW